MHDFPVLLELRLRLLRALLELLALLDGRKQLPLLVLRRSTQAPALLVQRSSGAPEGWPAGASGGACRAEHVERSMQAPLKARLRTVGHSSR